MLCCSRRQDSNSSPRLLILPLALTCILHMAHLLSAIPVMPCSLLFVPPKWEHILCVQLLPPKEVLVPPLRVPTILLVLILVQEQVLFPKPRALVLPMVKFGQSKSDRLGHIDTVDSDLMHHQLRLSLLQWNPGPARRNPANIVSAAYKKFMRLFFRKRTLATRTSLSCSTRTPGRLESTHGKRFESTHGVFSVPHHTAHTTPHKHTRRHTTIHTPPTHGDRDRERRQRKRNKGKERRREKKKREEKRREEKREEKKREEKRR